MTFKFKRSYCSLVEMRLYKNRLRLKDQEPRVLEEDHLDLISQDSSVSHAGKKTSHMWINFTTIN